MQWHITSLLLNTEGQTVQLDGLDRADLILLRQNITLLWENKTSMIMAGQTELLARFTKLLTKINNMISDMDLKSLFSESEYHRR